jgi:regulatory protein
MMEVEEKLREVEAKPEECTKIIDYLLKNNFVNQARFATQYAGGKFRTKHWGRHKIVQALKMKRISPELIQQALKTELPPDDYYNTAYQLATKKALTLTKTENHYQKTIKIANYLAQKGYETDLALEVAKAAAADTEN